MAALIFDYDGTLHDCIKIYAPSFQKAYSYLVSRKQMPKRLWTEREISTWLGYPANEMWNCFAPGFSQTQKDACSQMIGSEMLRLVYEHQAQLYPGICEMLDQLKHDGHTLVFLSNCKHDYMSAHQKQFQLEQYFAEFFCGEDFSWKSKLEIWGEVKNKFSGEILIIGDRFHEMEIAQTYGLKSIGCSYGYGSAEELEGADLIASNPLELYSVIQKLI